MPSEKNAIDYVVAGVLIIAISSLLLTYVLPFRFHGANDSGWTPEGVRQVATANNQFAIELLQQLGSNDTNVFFSPFSLSQAMAILYEGATGETAKEIRGVFHFPENDTVRRANFAAILNRLPSDEYKLLNANALWIRDNFRVKENFVNVATEHFLSDVFSFHDPFKVVDKVNEWACENTNGLLCDVMRKEDSDPQLVMIITNAMYFKGFWKEKFDPSNTKPMDFHTPTGTKKVEMMYKRSEHTKYYENNDLKAIEMDYKGNMTMLVILPKSKNVTEVLNELNASRIDEIRSQMRSTCVDIYFPKFEFRTDYHLKDTLSAMGMPIVFTPGAEFDKLTDEKVWVDKVIHSAYVKVDEEGTEAAAVTVVTIIKALASCETFKADHPFIFFIIHKPTNTILFAGIVSDPTQGS